MLGSVANHAWSEDSLYLKTARGGDILVERESKHTTSGTFKIKTLRNRSWTPTVTDDRLDDDSDQFDPEARPESEGSRRQATSRASTPAEKPAPTARGKTPLPVIALTELGVGWHKTAVVAELMHRTQATTRSQLNRLADRNKVEKSSDGGSWKLIG